MRALLAAFVVLFAAAAASADDMGKLLAEAVDLPTPADRAAAASRLAQREDIALTDWLNAMRAFGGHARVPPGPLEETPSLFVGDASEPTAISVRVPPGYVPGRPAPLLLAFHGAGGTGRDEDALWAAAADKLGMLLVCPTDPTADHGYDFSEKARQRAYAALRWARRRLDVDENRVFVTGVSRGGHLAWDVTLRRADQFAALVPMIGSPKLAPEAMNNLRYLENVAHLPIRDLQGAKDDLRMVQNLRWAFRKLRDLRARDAELVEFPDLGHDFDPHAVDWAAFLGAVARSPLPLRVVRAASRLDEARAFWAEATVLGPLVKETFRADLAASKLAKMDEDQKRVWFQEEVDKRTARIEAKIDGPARFTVTTSQVVRYRLLLSAEMYEPATSVDLVTNGKPATKPVAPSKLVLLRDFVERFDRTFLPVAEVCGP